MMKRSGREELYSVIHCGSVILFALAGKAIQNGHLSSIKQLKFLNRKDLWVILMMDLVKRL